MAGNTCKFPECGRVHYGRGWCHTHYAQEWRGEKVREIINDLSLEQRFWRHVLPLGDDDCWIWTGGLHAHGYGTLSYKGETLIAHRVSYELHSGPIPNGLHIDHKCRIRECVNPNHLQAVTIRENTENTSPLRNNSTGVRGVSLRDNGSYRARVGHKMRVIHVGDFKTLEEAAEAVKEARLRLHTNNLNDRGLYG